MFNSSVASSSRHSIDVFWQMPPDKYPFPMSDLRSADLRCFRTTALPTTPPARRSTASAESVYLDPSPSKYSSAVTLRTQIRPGVWSDGNDRVLSAACPTVQAFLACARHDMNLPVAPSELVFALAALEVFYSIDDPVHWMFWSDEKKNQTAEVVSRISLHRPQLIQSRVAWNGTPEYLFILSGLHGPTSLPLYEHKEWYPILNPSKVQSPPRLLNLRKRKVQQLNQSESSGNADGDEDIEVKEPRPKRAKAASSSSLKTPKSPPIVFDDTDQAEIPEMSPTTSLSSCEDPDERSSSLASAEVPGEDSSSSTDTPVLTKGNVRKRKPKARQSSPTPDPPIIIRETLTSPISVLLTPSTVSHSRNRSISQASSQTLVAARERRSLSVLSAITAVEILTVAGVGDEEIKADQSVSDSENEHEESGMVTRGRANKARNVVQGREAKRPAKTRVKRKSGAKTRVAE